MTLFYNTCNKYNGHIFIINSHLSYLEVTHFGHFDGGGQGVCNADRGGTFQ